MRIEKLYMEARNGNKEAVESLHRELFERFSLFAHRRVWNREEAEDMVQSALTTVFAEYEQATIHVSFAAWAHKVLENKLLTYIQTKRRQGGRYVNLESLEIATDSWEPDPALRNRVLSCFKRIIQANRRYARILNLHFQGFSREEVCEKLNISPSQSYVVLSRARAMMRECIEKSGNNE